MTNIIQDMAGVDFMTEKDIVTELILTGKNALNRYISVLSDVTSPNVRRILTNQLNQVLDIHGRMTDYALMKGYFHPSNPQVQFTDDLKEAFTALDLETWKLQSDDESYGLKRDLPIVRS